MYQAIVTKYHGPTNTRGSRVSARAEAGRCSIEWDNELNVEENHTRAAETLRDKLGWVESYHGRMCGGALPRPISGYAFVFVK